MSVKVYLRFSQDESSPPIIEEAITRTQFERDPERWAEGVDKSRAERKDDTIVEYGVAIIEVDDAVIAEAFRRTRVADKLENDYQEEVEDGQ